MNKFKKYFNKIFLGFATLLAVVTAFVVPSFAYTENGDGNLVSENVVDYSSINSSKFTNLGDGAFSLNWGGLVTTISIPTDLSNNSEIGSYTISVDLVSGVGYALYQWYWVYSDSTTEKITTNQSLVLGNRYTYVSDASKILTGLQVVCNNSSTYKDLMLNKGSTALSYEPYGVVYYSQDNYNNALYNDYGIFRLCSSIDLKLTWIDGSNRVVNYSWNNILDLITDKTYIKCSNGVFSYNNSSLSMDLLGGSSNATAMWQFNFVGTYPSSYPSIFPSLYPS